MSLTTPAIWYPLLLSLERKARMKRTIVILAVMTLALLRAGDGEVRLVGAEPRDETRPTPAEVRQNQLDRTFVHHRTGMPFRVALTQTNVDRRPGSGGVVLLSSVALPPPRD